MKETIKSKRILGGDSPPKIFVETNRIKGVIQYSFEKIILEKILER